MILRLLETALRVMAAKFEADAEDSKLRQLSWSYDRYEIQRNRVREAKQELNDAVANGAHVNDLRLLQDDLESKIGYLRTLGSHIKSRQGIPLQGGDTDPT